MAVSDFPFHRSQPGFFEQLGEIRALGEMAAFVPSLPILLNAPKGDGHPVLVMPGMYADDSWTFVIRRYLEVMGYRVHPWKLGMNMGLTRRSFARAADRFAELAHRYGDERVSLVGWSLGGVFAREIAKAYPSKARQVVTLASPFRAGYRASGRMDPELAERLKAPPPVPTTAIYSRSDGVVPWAACKEDEGETRENIEVPASHFGLGVNPLVLWAIADRLALEDGAWQPFDRSGFLSLVYGGA